MSSRYWIVVVGSIACGLGALSPTPLQAQEHSISQMDWKLRNLRPSGQPVVPLFDGWHAREDGTYDLCFGYFNLNLEEEVDIPLGPDNFIEPAQFDGGQPTHFEQVPEGYRRRFCVFTVNVPRDFGEQRVVWTLRLDGQTYSVPGHLVSVHYGMLDLADPSREVVAPVVRFVAPEGPEGRGRKGVTAGPVSIRVGEPLEVAIAVAPPEGVEARRWWVLWALHQGPGDVTFDPDELNVEEGQTSAKTTAVFSDPGEYLLRVQVVDGGGGSFSSHCCWTNGFVKVIVTR